MSGQLFQRSTLANMMPGLYDGSLTIADLLKHADTSIGTCQSLDGEMIIIDGHAYAVRGSGKVDELGGDVLVPFAQVQFNQADKEISLNDEEFTELKDKLLKTVNTENLFFGVKITGKFSYMKTRAVFKQEKPYPDLNSVADDQAIFEEDDTEGTVVGFFTPTLFQGIGSAGFHLHYLNNDHTMGGHILDLKVEKAGAELHLLSSLNVSFPEKDPKFLSQKLNLDKMDQNLRKAEG